MARAKNSPQTAAVPACPEGPDLPSPTREDDIAAVRQQIEAFEEKLDEFESDLESSGWDDIGDFRSQLDDLRLRLKGLRAGAEALEAIADAAWPDARQDLENGLLEAAGTLKELEAGLKMVLPE
jgi:chromosome segregation ATPase